MKKTTLLLITMLSLLWQTQAQHNFATILGPENVAQGSPVTLSINTVGNTAAVPTDSYEIFTVTADWVNVSDAYSSEADLTLTTTAGSVTIDPPSSGSFDSFASTTLTFSGTLPSGSYDPSIDGFLEITLNQSYAGSSANWSNIVVSISAPLYSGPPIGVTCSSGSSSFVFTENFESDPPSGWTGTGFSGTNGNWDITNANTNSNNTGPSIAYDNGSGMHLEYEASGDSSATASAISPAIDLTSTVDDAELSFYLHAYGAAMGTLNVGVSNSASGPFTTLFTQSGQIQTAAGDAWTHFGVNLGAYVGQTIYIEFRHTGSGTDYTGDMSIDYIRVEACDPPCPTPDNIVVSNIGSTTADITWDAGDSETDWEIVVQPDGTGIPGGVGTATTNNNPYNATGLTQLTAYEIYVRADCGMVDGYSDWVGPIDFTTLAACPDITSLTIDSYTASSANISWTAGSTETDWEIVVQPDGTGIPGGAGTATTNNNPYIASSLSQLTAYEVYVRADCGMVDGYSNWVGPVDFTTGPANDDFANATPISCGNIYIGDTSSATIDEAGAPDVSTVEPDTDTDNDSPNVWFRFIGTGDPVTLSTCTNTSYDSEIIVFTGTSGSLTNIAEGYDECGAAYEAEVTFSSVLGVSYSISVEGWNVGNTGTFELSVICTPPAPVTYTYSGSWSPSDPSGIATAGDDIVIASGDASINSNTTVNSVTVNAGAGLTVDSGVILTATNGLVLESSSTSYSSLILDGTVTGTLTYERHVNINGSGDTGSNDLISAPLTGQAFNAFATANPNILNNGTLYLFGPFDKTTANYLLYAGSETATLNAGVGYRAGSSDNGTFTFTGVANSGIVSYNIENYGPPEPAEAEWNLVGNPYPSYLNVHAFLNHEVSVGVSNLALFKPETAAIYGYDGNALDDWTIYNLANTTASTVIAPGQGFFVSANVTNVPLYDLEFSPDMRRTGSGDDFIVGRNAQLTYVKLYLSTANKSYGTDIYFNNNASSGFDVGYDASIWGETAPDFAIYSHLIEDNSGKAMALQTLNHTDLSDISISLGVNANQGEQLRFSISDMTLPDSVNVYLEDRVENTITLLNNVDYVITPSTPLSGTGRFFLRTSQEALSTIDNNIDNLTIFALNTSKEIVVNGQLKENTILSLYDIQGRKVLSTTLDDSNLTNRIDISDLNGGVYIVTVQNNSQQKTQKVVIK
ncbi:T9SS-dependent choice-of-anchor J family protein [Psychroserpens ponticola]|uniref:Choice-of-anchor J domain-containing protein n=1 Tax=Psychroserpens ponticola TaxID=2932268 RepID=A0ABY7RWS0_9FLAO|nr:choice-of-anchor J domain-containing protein [Psychroserpens ponticola]WCO01145.1 choice-of-anchor J domain-containing protein [Psychroserpens ponticola]